MSFIPNSVKEYLIPQSLKGYLVHLGIVTGIGIWLLFYLFNDYLPEYTRHGEEITVPDIQGKNLSEVENLLKQNGLRHLIFDSVYVDGAVPYTIMTQKPKAGEKVKKDRKIYLSVTSKYPTLVKMPNLVNMTLKNALLQLSQAGLKLGDTSTVDDRFTLILKQKIKGKPVRPGTDVPKFSKVDLVIGNGQYSQEKD